MPHREIQHLLDRLDEGFRGPAWHGPALRASLRGLDHRRAALRPAPGRHNIWEFAVHTAFWKFAVRRRLLAEPDQQFPLDGRNFFERPSKSDGTSDADLEKAWQRDLKLLAKTHHDLRRTVAALSPASIDRPARSHRQTPRFMVEGIAMHDVYHAGQIQLIRKLLDA